MIENFLNEVLSKIGAGSKEYVYISVTPGVGLEMIQIDSVLKAVKAYGFRPLDYSDAMREIENYDQFHSALEELFAELNINPKCNIILNMPAVYFGKIDLPLLLSDESITEAIISEVEQSYVFKRCEPVVNWFDSNNAPNSDTRTIFYSALQKPAVEKINYILTSMGATLSRLEISLISSLRALSFADLTETQMVDNTAWNLLTVNSNGYSILAMSGKNIVDYYEEPLALKTYEPEEIHGAVAASAQIALMSLPTNYLYIVSESDLVSAEMLASKISIEGTVDFLENNSFKKKEILPVSLNILPDQVMKISLEAIGVGVVGIHNYPINLDLSGNNSKEITAGEQTISFRFNGKEIVLTETVLKKITIIFGVALIVPTLLALLTLPILQKRSQAKLDDINSQIQEIDTKINNLTDKSGNGAFVVKTEIERVLKNNRAKLISYSALGESVPKNLWLTYFSTKNDGKIDIKGISENVEDIYKFFKNLKDSMADTQLRLYNLQMMSDSLDDAVDDASNYEFEITNMSETEVNPQAAKPAEVTSQPVDAEAQNTEPQTQSAGKKVNDLEPVDVPVN